MFGCYTLRKRSTPICGSTIACCLATIQKSMLTILSQKEYLDKTLVNYANVMGLQADAGINGTLLKPINKAIENASS